MSDVKTASVLESRRERRRRHKSKHRSSSFLKFSGMTLVGQSFLADTGNGPTSNVPHAYPVPAPFKTGTMSATIFTTIPVGGSMTIQCVRNGVPVPGFSITFNGGDIGTKSVTQRVPFAKGDTIGLVVISVVQVLLSLLVDVVREPDIGEGS
jgi:hypothetical protein